jgi:HAD superfamily hydrolase (TIGR01509 family)
MIKTIIFDLGGVYFTEGAGRFCKILEEKFNIPQEKSKEIILGETGTKYRIGDINADEFWKEAKAYWGLEAPADQLAQLWHSQYLPVPGTIEIIERLQRAGYELFFLSDSIQERVDYLQLNHPFLHQFRSGVFSHHVKARKPDPKIYQAVLKLSEHKPEECVFIDDKPALLEPARQLGMKGIAFQDPASLELELKQMGLIF